MTRSASLVPAAGVLLGTLFGFAIATASQPSAPGQGDPGLEPLSVTEGEDPNLAAILAELRRIGERLSESRTPAAVGAPPPSNQRQPADSGGSGPAEVTSLLERCAALLERLEARTSGSAAVGMRPAPSSASREPLVSLEGSEWEAVNEFSKQHLLWTYQQVLDRYGMPDQVVLQNGIVTWYYLVQTLTDRNNWSFQFCDGMVIGVRD